MTKKEVWELIHKEFKTQQNFSIEDWVIEKKQYTLESYKYECCICGIKTLDYITLCDYTCCGENTITKYICKECFIGGGENE